MEFLAELIENDRRFFQKYQRIILKVVNSRIGRWYFHIQEHPIHRKFVRIDPNALYFFSSKGLTIEFRTAHRYANRLKHSFRFLRIFAPIQLTIFRPVSPVGFLMSPYVLMATSTLYPDAGNPGSTTVDGSVTRTSGGLGAGEAWSTLRGGSGTSTSPTSPTDAAIWWVADNVSNQWRIMGRSIFTFDTSAIEAGSIVGSAAFSLWVNSLTTPTDATASKRELRVVASTPASNSALVASDYSNTGGTSFGKLTFATVTTGAYNDVVLDANGIANVAIAGISKFGARSGADLDNSAPTWGLFDSLLYQVAMADTGGTSNDPKLTVVVTTVAKTLSDSVTHTDIRSMRGGKTLAETVTHTDAAPTLLLVIQKILTETVTHTDSMLRAYVRIIGELVTYTDTKIHSLAKVFTESASHVEALSKTAARILAEVGSFLDTLNLRNLWTTRSIPTTNFTDRTKPSSSWTDRTKPPTTWS